MVQARCHVRRHAAHDRLYRLTPAFDAARVRPVCSSTTNTSSGSESSRSARSTERSQRVAGERTSTLAATPRQHRRGTPVCTSGGRGGDCAAAAVQASPGDPVPARLAKPMQKLAANCRMPRSSVSLVVGLEVTGARQRPVIGGRGALAKTSGHMSLTHSRWTVVSRHFTVACDALLWSARISSLFRRCLRQSSSRPRDGRPRHAARLRARAARRRRA